LLQVVVLPLIVTLSEAQEANVLTEASAKKMIDPNL
jgi:hypothetical protein